VVGKICCSKVCNGALKRPKIHPEKVSAAPVPSPVSIKLNLLDSLDLTLRLDKDDYEEQLITEQARFSGLMRDKRMRRHALVAVFEGNDAAGKGGAIKRVAAALDPRQYNIVPIAAPTEEERAQPYLWRFWRHIPARGKFTVFDRSWYGRVLVERIEGFCSPADWLRAYGEINDFEEQVADAGVVVVKFWLAIDKQTQLERFRSARRSLSNASRSPRTTGAIATNGTTTAKPWATWSTAPAPKSPRGPWSKPTTSAGRG
jgi:polyphosphate kinase 2 (PPK2 family)